MRDRLIELIKQSDKAFGEKYEGQVMSHIGEIYEFVADYLLANGVIVPPCKVGDTVWFIEQGICFGDKRISKGFVERFEIRELPGMGLTHNVVIIPRDAIDNRMHFSLFECFDEDCYTSREEAEQALKGGD